MRIFKLIASISLQVLALLSVLISLVYVYFLIFADTTSIGVNNISDQLAVDVKAEKDLTEEEKNLFEERWFMEVNYYSNSKNNGIKLQELKFNYFMSPKLLQSDYRASGMQYVGDFETYRSTDTNYEKRVVPDFYYYDTVDGISYSGYSGVQTQSVATLLNRETELIIKIDNRPFTIQLTGSYDKGWWIFKNTTYYDYGDLFQNVMDAIESNSAGYGDYYITLDLSYFFSIKEMDKNGNFKTDDVTDIIKNYAVLKFHYDENGAIYSHQSMFGKIENNSKYDKSTISFWAGKMVYTLTEKDFHYRYDDKQSGYYLSMPNELKLYFSEKSNFELNVDINLDSSYLIENHINVLGFDFNAFRGFDIDTLTIKGISSEFKVLDAAFSNAKLNTLKHSAGLIFDGEFGIDFNEVII